MTGAICDVLAIKTCCRCLGPEPELIFQREHGRKVPLIRMREVMLSLREPT